ncbi:hypothetical protein [Pantoea sp. A4]|uniref:hypothetical protein n=1 Tax=Pantoea sp. A4 TaxID=1225184 RepID=UPI0003606810|nr:hypothetical protein [Pantoea sp. A4]
MINLDKYLSVTWQMGGRAYPVLDCYGLVHEVRRDLGLPEWPLFEGILKEGDAMGRACSDFQCNVKPCQPRQGAVAAVYTAGMVSHLGIVVEVAGQLQVMESNPKKNVTVLPVNRFERQYVKVEYYQ